MLFLAFKSFVLLIVMWYKYIYIWTNIIFDKVLFVHMEYYMFSMYIRPYKCHFSNVLNVFLRKCMCSVALRTRSRSQLSFTHGLKYKVKVLVTYYTYVKHSSCSALMIKLTFLLTTQLVMNPYRGQGHCSCWVY